MAAFGYLLKVGLDVDIVSRTYADVTGRQPVISGRQVAADTRFLNKYGETPKAN